MPEVEHKAYNGFSAPYQRWVEAASPFDPPQYANEQTKIAYERLRTICSNMDINNPKILDYKEWSSIIRETYYQAQDFIGIRNDLELCNNLDNIYWWKLHGSNIYWLACLSFFSVIAVVFSWVLWKKRQSALNAVDETIISGLASGVRLKRKTLKGLDEFKRRVRDKADRDQNSN